MIKIKGIEFDVSMSDVDVIEKYEKAADKLAKVAGNPESYKGLSTADAFRKQCEFTEEFLDETLGAGASEKIFKGKKDLVEHFKACDELIQGYDTARKAIADITNKYAQKQRNSRPRPQDHKSKGGK